MILTLLMAIVIALLIGATIYCYYLYRDDLAYIFATAAGILFVITTVVAFIRLGFGAAFWVFCLMVLTTLIEMAYAWLEHDYGVLRDAIIVRTVVIATIMSFIMGGISIVGYNNELHRATELIAGTEEGARDLWVFRSGANYYYVHKSDNEGARHYFTDDEVERHINAAIDISDISSAFVFGMIIMPAVCWVYVKTEILPKYTSRKRRKKRKLQSTI